MTAISRWRSANQACRNGRPLRDRCWPHPPSFIRMLQHLASLVTSSEPWREKRQECLQSAHLWHNILIITGRFGILPVCRLSMIFLSHRCLCWGRLKRYRRGYLFYFQRHSLPHRQGRKTFSPSQTSHRCSCLTAIKKKKKLDLRMLAGVLMFKSQGREIFIIFGFLYQAARSIELWTRQTRMS